MSDEQVDTLISSLLDVVQRISQKEDATADDWQAMAAIADTLMHLLC